MCIHVNDIVHTCTMLQLPEFTSSQPQAADPDCRNLLRDHCTFLGNTIAVAKVASGLRRPTHDFVHL